jgi:hypothetical protein
MIPVPSTATRGLAPRGREPLLSAVLSAVAI